MWNSTQVVANRRKSITVTIQASASNVNVYSLYGSPSNITNVRLIVASGVTLSASSTGVRALDFRGFAAGSTFTLINNGLIRGYGGNGGAGGVGLGNGFAGQAGGHAIIVNANITIDNTSGNIWGGGGGGGGAGGFRSGPKANSCNNQQGAAGGRGAGPSSKVGNGGNYGQNGGAGAAGQSSSACGTAGSGGAGGAGGRAILIQSGAIVTFSGGNNSSQVRGSVA